VTAVTTRRAFDMLEHPASVRGVPRHQSGMSRDTRPGSPELTHRLGHDQYAPAWRGFRLCGDGLAVVVVDKSEAESAVYLQLVGRGAFCSVDTSPPMWATIRFISRRVSFDRLRSVLERQPCVGRVCGLRQLAEHAAEAMLDVFGPVAPVHGPGPDWTPHVAVAYGRADVDTPWVRSTSTA
jgi:hypothetical protein